MIANLRYNYLCCGRVQEWFNWTLSKSVVPQGTVGSNPTPSAMKNGLAFVSPFFMLRA
jgi:hypothetical protein